VTKPTQTTDHTQRIHATSAHLVALDELTGGTELARAAVRAARSAQDTAHRHGDPEVAAAAAETLQIAGWLAYDADQQGAVHRAPGTLPWDRPANGDGPWT
jgi:hypothetical protein